MNVTSTPMGPPIAWPDDFSSLPLAEPLVSALAPYDPAPPPSFIGVQAPRPTPPISGGTLAVSAGGKAVISDPDRDQLYVVDIGTARVETVTLSQGDEPGRIATNQERAYVALRNGGGVVTVELSSARITQKLAVCAAPRGLSYDETASRVLVACAGGDLVSLSPDGKSVLGRVQVAPDLRDVGRDAQGVWVSQFRAAKLLRLDDALHIARVQTPASPDVSLVRGVAASGQRFTPTLAWRTVPGPDGEPFMLHQRSSSSVLQTKPSPDPKVLVSTYGATAPEPQKPARGFCKSAIVHTTISRFGEPEPSALKALIEAVLPSDLAFAPDGRLLAAVAPGNFVRQKDATRPAIQLYVTRKEALARAGADTHADPPDCLQGAGRWEHHFPGEAIALAFADAKTLLVHVRNPAELNVFRFDDQDQPRLAAVIPLSDVNLRDSGHEIFHQNTGAGIACVSCHGEALDDGHVWNFDTGARRTQHLRGSVIQHAPFHWSGDLAGIDPLMSEVYQRRMGGAPLWGLDISALTHWLANTGYVRPEAGDAARVARGRALFEHSDVGCASCHASSELRTDGLRDVGTGGAFKVPSLRGVALRLPLMHTGCADTLEKRFDPACGGSAHGNTSQLTSTQLADLVAYLDSL